MVQNVTVQEGGRIEVTVPELRPGSMVKVTVELAEESVTESERAPDQPKGNGLRRFFGAVSLGHATGTTNEEIDADLAREYGRGLK
ncbi:MAG TPA: hypothetical protein VGP72_22360 [Planctomycetota bacterium]|jgi:hypothetical protein